MFDGNYFSLVDDYWRLCQQSASAALSPLDWAYLGAYQNADIPIEAVLWGMERTFQHHRRAGFVQAPIRRLSYCGPEIYHAYEEILADGGGDLLHSLRRRFLGVGRNNREPLPRTQAQVAPWSVPHRSGLGYQDSQENQRRYRYGHLSARKSGMS